MKNLILLMSLWLSGPASATTEQMLSNWFKNDTQKTAELFQQGQYEKAAKSFKDNYRRGVALYRIGDYEAAASAFQHVTRAVVQTDALYNLGNSYYQLERYRDAIETYEQVGTERV